MREFEVNIREMHTRIGLTMGSLPKHDGDIQGENSHMQRLRVLWI